MSESPRRFYMFFVREKSAGFDVKSLELYFIKDWAFELNKDRKKFG